MSKFSYAAIAAVAAAILMTATSALQGQAPSWNVSYTDAQAKRGAALYAANCVVCHGKDLAGTERAPAAGGPAFAARWQARPVAELLDYVHTQMPLHAPGGLSRQQSADIVAYLLSRSNAPAGSAELSGGPAPAPARSRNGEDGVVTNAYYTKEQALRGKTAFNRNCAFCHTVDAKMYSAENNSTILPSTFGGHFVERVYHGHVLYPTVYHLYSKMQSMPAFDTKAISEQTRADILSYILQNNGLPSGTEELKPHAGYMKNMVLGEAGFQPLFNGKDFTGFKFVMNTNCTAQPVGCGKLDPGETLKAVDGEIRCIPCNIFGYFYWPKKYENFTFRYEQKFERPADWDASDTLYFGGTGALIFIQEPHRVYPRSIEIEGRYYDLGEPYAIGGKGTIKYDHEARMRAGRRVGEWDTIEVASRNGTVTTSINGITVSTISGHDYPAGHLGMQAEGGPVSWRNLRIKVE
jgi:S-disulfanyl-L-cysteine oxidoreductase SoxD